MTSTGTSAPWVVFLLTVSSATMLRESGEFFGTKIVPLEIDAIYATGDIDDELDFVIAEHVFKSFRQQFER